MLQNAYFLAKIGADTAENEQHFAEILPKTDTSKLDRRLDVRVIDDDGAQLVLADLAVTWSWVVGANKYRSGEARRGGRLWG